METSANSDGGTWESGMMGCQRYSEWKRWMVGATWPNGEVTEWTRGGAAWRSFMTSTHGKFGRFETPRFDYSNKEFYNII